MKILIPWHDPDIVSDCVQSAVENEVDGLALDTDESRAIIEIRTNKVLEKLLPWVEELEKLTIEFDTDTGVVVVLPTEAIRHGY